jgi:hypothetical protein
LNKEIATLKQACLRYLSKSLFKFLKNQGKVNKTPKEKISQTILSLNRIMIEGSHQLYKEHLKLMRHLRKEEGLI